MSCTTTTPENRTQISEHLQRYTLFDGRVVVYEMDGFSRQIFDDWHQATLETIAKWPKNQAMIAIHNFKSLSLTSYVSSRFKQVFMHHARIKGYFVVVVPDNLLGHVIQLFVQRLPAQLCPRITRHVCYSFDEAISYVVPLLERPNH